MTEEVPAAIEKDPITILRATTEDDIEFALQGANVGLPITTAAALLEAVNRVIDSRIGEGVGEDE